MDRRTFSKLAGLALLGAMADNKELYAQLNGASASANSGAEVVLEDNELLVAFDKASGALTRLVRKTSGWTIERRPEFGASFRLLAPLPEREANFVLGRKQHAAKVEKISANQVQIVWKDPISEHGGVVPLNFTATVTLEKGALTFDSILDNKSSLSIATVDYPYFGDLNSPAPEAPMRAEFMATGALQGGMIYPHFPNSGGWGVNAPTTSINSCQSLFCLVSAPEQGIYVGMHDPEIRYFLHFTFEQHPGVADPFNTNAPLLAEISDKPVHLEFRACHFLFAHPHSQVNLAPVVIRTYSGEWQSGLDVYREWRSTWFKQPHVAAWALDVHSWLQLRINGAEQDFLVPYNKLPKYIDECAENGVSAIQLVGWHHGGQDGGDPCMDTDPGLGTWEELREAIAYARSKGVNMILFGKPIFADMSTEWYKKELYKYEATDPHGDKYESAGYTYTTPTQLANINTRRRAIPDVCSQEYRDVATREFEKTVALGAAGWLFDEVMTHNGVIYSFSPNHGYTPPGYLFSADIPLVKQFRAVADKVNPDFLFSGEGPVDWLMPHYPLGYYRIGAGTRHALRYLDSKAPLMAAVRGFDDRETINLILAYRYVISYEPYNFKGHVTDFPLTLAYGKKVDALRRKYRTWIWDAEFRDSLGAKVTADGAVRHTVFRNSAGKRAVIVINQEITKPITATLEIPNSGRLMSATPEDPEARPTSGALKIPARSAMVVMEQ